MNAPTEPVTVRAAQPEAKGFRIPPPPADVVPGVPTSGTTYPVFETKAEIAEALRKRQARPISKAGSSAR